MQRFNWRKLFFYAAEMVFAIISGNAESSIYQAYLPPGSVSLGEANARAIITQIAIVLFSVAFVEAAQIRGKGRFFALAFIGLLNAAFSLQAFWFIREAALINEHANYLQPAWDHPLNLFGLLLNGSDVDPFLVASMPFFQVALSWVGPLIVREKVEETPDQQAARQQRELNEMRYKQERAKLRATGLVSIGKAAFNTARGIDDSPDQTLDESAPNDEQNTEQNIDKPIIKSAGIPKDKLTASMLIEYVKQTYNGAELSEADAQETIRLLGGKERATSAPGQPYIASKRKAIAWAKRQYSSDKVTPIAARKRA